MAALRTQLVDDVLVLYFTDSKVLDDNRIQMIGKELLEQVGQTPSGRLVLNFQGVSFMSSAMIGKLVLLNKKCKQDDVTLKMCDISPTVAEVFKIMRLNKVFDIYKSEEKAVAAFDKKGWFG